MNIICGPYLQNIGKDTITIMWHTDKPGSSIVEYDAALRLGWNFYEGRPEPNFSERVEDNQPATIHAVTLVGLKAGWEHHYRVSSKSPNGERAAAEGASFRTAPEDDSPFSFVTYGDSHTEHLLHKKTANLARMYRPDLCVGTGDIVCDEFSRFKKAFFNPTKNLLCYVPWFSSMGNHDAPNEGYFRYFSYPQPHYWYSFNYGCAHFNMLNSNLDYRSGSEQYAWLEQDLETFKEARWKFVLFHHPPYCSNHCEIEEARVLCSLFDRYGVDIIYNAHATFYERFHPIRDGQYDSANGTVYFVSGGAGYDVTRSPGVIWDHRHSLSAMAKTVSHFLLTSVARDECRVQAIDCEGRLFDTLVLTKPPAETAKLPPASFQLAYPDQLEEGTRVAGMEEGHVRWVLPRPQYSTNAQETHSGGNSVQWSNNGDESVFPALRRILVEDGTALEAVAGRKYKLSAWIKTKDVAGGVTLSFEYSGDQGFMDRIESEPLTGSNDWTEISVDVPALPDHIYWCRVVVSAKPGSTGTAWFDDVEVVEV